MCRLHVVHVVKMLVTMTLISHIAGLAFIELYYFVSIVEIWHY